MRVYFVTKGKCILFCVCLITIFCVAGCKNQNSNSGSFKQMTFNIDSTQIGEQLALTEYKLKLNPPVNMEKSEEFFKRLSANIEQTDKTENIFAAKPIAVLADKKLNILVISCIELYQKNPSEDGVKTVSEMIKKQFKSNNVKAAEFYKGDIKITQFLIQDSVNVIFKLLLTNPAKQIIQLDYVMPQVTYQNEIKAIESSIGTIKFDK